MYDLGVIWFDIIELKIKMMAFLRLCGRVSHLVSTMVAGVSAAPIICLAIVISAMCLLSTEASAQEQPKRYITHARIIGRDTIPHVNLPEVRCMARARFKSERQKRQWTRYIYNVKKVLPYARILSREFKIINDSLALMTTDKQRDQYLERKEKELFAKYEYNLKHLTVKQGRILIKLIDRETGSTSYEAIRLLKGRFKAFWWQSIARMFGSSLKVEYDPYGEDKNLENVVLLIDMGVY